MDAERHNYFGKEVRSKDLEDFSVSVTSHRPHSRAGLHSHSKPYLCLLVRGIYEERSRTGRAIVRSGAALFRGADHVHANDFYEDGGTCLNIEINDPEKFCIANGFKLPDGDFVRSGTVESYKLLDALGQGAERDLLNILCYESLFFHFDLLQVSGKPEWVRRIKERIHDDPLSGISLSAFSEEFGLHPNYLVRKFKQVTGSTLSEYLAKVRIESTLTKMLRTSDRLTAIAADSGFSDQSHFIRTYRKYFDHSPKAFRKLFRDQCGSGWGEGRSERFERA